MKELIAALLVLLFVSTLAASGDAELRPIVKIMMARLGWIQTMTVDYALSDFEKVKASAEALSAQAKKVSEGAAAGPLKDYNLKLSEAAMALADAAGKKDGPLTATKMGDVLSVCNMCHAAVRDK